VVNWAFALLGVSADADVGSVKRAYARLLRITRPDEDAEAFQRLHTAYQLVLAHAIGRQASAPAAADNAAPPVASPAGSAPDARATTSTESTTGTTDRANPPVGNARSPAAMETAAAANPRELATRIIQHAVEADDERALVSWLSALPEFWSIRIKQQTGQLVMQQLFRSPQPMAPTSLDVLLQFFDLQQVLSGVNPIALAQLRQRQHAMWYVLPENHRALALRLNIPTNRSPDASKVKACLRPLHAPLRWNRIVWPAINRGRVATTARLIHGLCGGQFDALPAQIDRRQAEFWYSAAQLAQPSWPRFIVGSVRAAFLGLMMLLGVALTCALSAALGHADIDWRAALGIGSIMAGGVVSLWLVYAAWTWLDHWQRLPESVTSRLAWLRRVLVPALCAIAVAADYLLKAPLPAILIIAPTLLLAVRRFAHRRPPSTSKRTYWGLAASLPGLAFLVMFLAKVASILRPDIFDHFPVLAIVASVALCLWVADLWRHRIYLRSRAAS
jgi:hypothetical protein